MEEEVTPEINEVWHYTTAAGLKGIIENNYLFACPATQMNDAKELLEGREIVENELRALSRTLSSVDMGRTLAQIGTVEDILTEAEDLFLISASTNGDNLSMWRNYGSTASYAIRFDPSKTLRPIVDPSMLNRRLEPSEVPGNLLAAPLPHAASSGSLDWLPVDYEGNVARELAEQIASSERDPQLEAATTSFLHDYRSRLFARVKHHSFEAESEVRRIIRIAPTLAFSGFRDTPRGLMHFIKVGYSESEAQKPRDTADGMDFVDCIRNPEKLPILEVRLSPTGHRASAARTLSNYLKSQDYGDVEVSASLSPYIG